jgi:hypothetical protein
LRPLLADLDAHVQSLMTGRAPASVPQAHDETIALASRP